MEDRRQLILAEMVKIQLSINRLWCTIFLWWDKRTKLGRFLNAPCLQTIEHHSHPKISILSEKTQHKWKKKKQKKKHKKTTSCLVKGDEWGWIEWKGWQLGVITIHRVPGELEISLPRSLPQSSSFCLRSVSLASGPLSLHTRPWVSPASGLLSLSPTVS